MTKVREHCFEALSVEKNTDEQRNCIVSTNQYSGHGKYNDRRLDPVVWDPVEGMLTANVSTDSGTDSPGGKMLLQMSSDSKSLYGAWISQACAFALNNQMI